MTSYIVNITTRRTGNTLPIVFTQEDVANVYYLHCDALVIMAIVARNKLEAHADG